MIKGMDMPCSSKKSSSPSDACDRSCRSTSLPPTRHRTSCRVEERKRKSAFGLIAERKADEDRDLRAEDSSDEADERAKERNRRCDDECDRSKAYYERYPSDPMERGGRLVMSRPLQQSNEEILRRQMDVDNWTCKQTRDSD